MNFEAFERRAQELFDTIPTEMRGGVEYLSVEPRSLRHPSMAGVYTLGECATGDLDLGSEFGSVERSGIHLYWGSFRALARDDPDFDWEAELWETLTHELRHHRESGAGEDALEDFDYAAEENFKRRAGEPFDPLFFRFGEEAEGGWRDVDGDRFLEMGVDDASLARRVQVRLDGRALAVEVAGEAVDVHYAYLEEVDQEMDVAVVMVRKRGLRERLIGLIRPRMRTVAESSAPWSDHDPDAAAFAGDSL